jgi:hypothetical protein
LLALERCLGGFGLLHDGKQGKLLGGALGFHLDTQALLCFLGTLKLGERLQLFLRRPCLASSLFVGLSALGEAEEIFLRLDLSF